MMRWVRACVLMGSMGCGCEDPVNADLTVHLMLADGVSTASVNVLYMFVFDSSGKSLARRYESTSVIEFPYDVVWDGKCDEGQITPGVYSVTAFLSAEYLAVPYVPGPDELRGSDQVEIIETSAGRRAVNELFITIAQH